MRSTSLRDNVQVHIPRDEHTDPQLTYHASSEEQEGDKYDTNKYYCVDSLAEFRDCWLTCDKNYSPNATVKGGIHILHNFVTCRGSISYFRIFVKKPKTFIKWKQHFSLLGLFMVHMCREYILLVGETFFWNTFQLSENSFLTQMFDWSQLLISLVKSQYLV